MEVETEIGHRDLCKVCGCETAPDDDGIWFCTNPFCSNYPRDGRKLYNDGWYREHLILREDLNRIEEDQ